MTSTSWRSPVFHHKKFRSESFFSRTADSTFTTPEQEAEGGQLRPVRMIVPGDGKRSSSKPVPFFAWDNALYLLGLPPNDRSPSWAKQRFESFRAKHTSLKSKIPSSFFTRVCAFLENWNPDDAIGNELLAEISSHYGVFQAGESSTFLHMDPEVVAWWKKTVENNLPPDGQCLITGERARIARLHPTIKGITPPKGKQQQDGPLVSIDRGKTAFSWSL